MCCWSTNYYVPAHDVQVAMLVDGRWLRWYHLSAQDSAGPFVALMIDIDSPTRNSPIAAPLPSETGQPAVLSWRSRQAVEHCQMRTPFPIFSFLCTCPRLPVVAAVQAGPGRRSPKVELEEKEADVHRDMHCRPSWLSDLNIDSLAMKGLKLATHHRQVPVLGIPSSRPVPLD